MKRFAVVLLALIMMFAVCAIAEEAAEEVFEVIEEEEVEVVEEESDEEIIEAVYMYVANCGTVNVYAEPDFNSEVVTRALRNYEVEVVGEPVENGWYNYYPVTVDGYNGYILVDYLADKRETYGHAVYAREDKLIIVRTAPSLSAPIADKPYLWHGTLRKETVCCLEYFLNTHWAYLTTKIDGVVEEVGYIYLR